MKRLGYRDYKGDFSRLLAEVSEMEDATPERFYKIIELLYLAYKTGYKVGIGTDNKNPGVTVAYIELPTGQISWHMPNEDVLWDGHSTEEKNKRIREFLLVDPQ